MIVTRIQSHSHAAPLPKQLPIKEPPKELLTAAKPKVNKQTAAATVNHQRGKISIKKAELS
jgi:hypothetical protein